jgi:AraC-like DNA-binding protein
MPPASSPAFAVDRLRGVDLRPAIAYRGSVDPQSLRLRVNHPYYTWWWVERGRVDVRWSEGSARLEPSDWIFLPRGRPRSHRIEAGSELVSFSFDLAWPDGGAVLMLEHPLRGRRDSALRGTALRALAGLHRDRGPLDHRAAGMAGWLQFCAGCFALVASLVARSVAAGVGHVVHREVDPRLRPILEELARAPRIGPLPEDRWRETAGLGRAQLDRLARAHCGSTLRGWRDRLVAAEVRRRLDLGRDSLKEIAADLGFADGAHFNHWVRRHLGTAPSRWRRQSV